MFLKSFPRILASFAILLIGFGCWHGDCIRDALDRRETQTKSHKDSFKAVTAVPLNEIDEFYAHPQPEKNYLPAATFVAISRTLSF